MENDSIAIVTGVGRANAIGAAIVRSLSKSGFDIAFTWWPAYDQRVHGAKDEHIVQELTSIVEQHGQRAFGFEADLNDPSVPEQIFDVVQATLGTPRALILSHCESVDSNLLETSVESFDRHFAVNARASWLLIREFGLRFSGPFGSGRIVSLTSDATVGNIPYGASKGALDRITLAAAHEFAGIGITSNVINPGLTDTGWMSPDERKTFVEMTPLGRLGMPEDAAHLVAFLCSKEGSWINGQLLHSDGGFHG
jgi:3-oxoacyl-[acyl-carrier protein] reductase